MQVFSKAAVSSVVLGVLGVMSAVHAAPITVDNFSFELPATANNAGEQAVNANPTSWTYNGNTNGTNNFNQAGYASPGNGNYTASAGGPINSGTSNGNQYAFINLHSESGIPSQFFTYTGPSLGTFTPGNTYDLVTAVGWRNDFGGRRANYRIDLTSNGTVVATSGTFTGATQNTFVDLAIPTYTAVDSGTIGIIVVGIRDTTQGAALQQAHFDNVRLNVTEAAVPEPATLGVLGLGAAGLLSRRRRSA